MKYIDAIALLIGVDLRNLFLFFPRILRYFFQYFQYRKIENKIGGRRSRYTLRPMIHDAYQQAGNGHSQYFYQDIIVARSILSHQPKRHVDVGSRIDGFVSSLAVTR